MQLRFQSGYTSSDYVAREGWRSASLLQCPLHPRVRCGFTRHGTYERVDPPGTLIPRWYCRQGHCTFSLLPDHLCARLTGTLAQVEAVVLAAEQAPSLPAVIDSLRPDDVTLPTALRWVRRRVRLVQTALAVVVSLMPERCLGWDPTLQAFRLGLACAPALTALRGVTAKHLAHLPRPLGFLPPTPLGGGRESRFQHRRGTDPPGSGG